MNTSTSRDKRRSRAGRWFFVGLLACSACGEAPELGSPAVEVTATAQGANTTAAAAFATHQAAPLRRKGPSLASTIYGVGCSVDADCAIIPAGDVCACSAWGAVTQADYPQFMQRRARLGGRCAGGVAAECSFDPEIWEPRCRSNQCVADHPRALACVDAVLPTTMPVTQPLVAGFGSHDPALSACPFAVLPPQGSTQVWSLRPGVSGKYRIILQDHAKQHGHDRWLYIRTPDCNGANVTCRWCAANAERCFVDEVIGPDDTAVIVVRNCDARCTLQVDRWDPSWPLEPPFSTPHMPIPPSVSTYPG